jgi:predicted TIM-barrel enzyme
MLHLAGPDRDERLAIARREVAALAAGGVDAVVVENYFGDVEDVIAALEWLEAAKPPLVVGLNVLRDYRAAFALAARFDVKFIQIDSVAGHLPPAEDAAFADELARLRRETPVYLLGGVRFKYQPVRSGRSLEEDLRLGMERCDALVVTGEATGQETDLDKVRRFRAIVGGDFPLLIGAGLTADNCREQLAVADGAIVGSYFKDTHRDDGTVEPAHVAEVMAIVDEVRRERAGVAGEAGGNR